MCSNGNAYEQHCAPGSRNSGYDRYQYGKDYYYHDFCDVNLVDTGYAAAQNGYAGGYAGPGGPGVVFKGPGYGGGVGPRPGGFQGFGYGKCTSDGLYYNNKYSFMICSNGNAYEQHCAPGSMNSGYERYEFGKDYYYHDFCDVNLVDTGYTTQQGYGDGYGAGYDGHEAEYHHEHHGNEGYAVLEKHESDYPAPGQAAAVYPMQGKQNKGYPGRGKQDPSYPNFGKTDRDYPMSGKQDRGYSAKGGDYTNSKNFEAQRYGYGKGYKAGYD
ncbi:hypothetical protein LSH36_435g00001 [Paralvinella palmiformis]|uniref:Uncharacterized protein n=1 Tax=Paralvinella palmiformis TaxID=53620 RepID=A0AAD9JB54_9ANNE|nr:hypothetical protein LSH36_435g00001 [Paralvinella palmiformis]